MRTTMTVIFDIIIQVTAYKGSQFDSDEKSNQNGVI
jgi:hypothetical protein